MWLPTFVCSSQDPECLIIKTLNNGLCPTGNSRTKNWDFIRFDGRNSRVEFLGPDGIPPKSKVRDS